MHIEFRYFHALLVTLDKDLASRKLKFIKMDMYYKIFSLHVEYDIF